MALEAIQAFQDRRDKEKQPLNRQRVSGLFQVNNILGVYVPMENMIQRVS